MRSWIDQTKAAYLVPTPRWQPVVTTVIKSATRYIYIYTSFWVSNDYTMSLAYSKTETPIIWNPLPQFLPIIFPTEWSFLWDWYKKCLKLSEWRPVFCWSHEFLPNQLNQCLHISDGTTPNGWLWNPMTPHMLSQEEYWPQVVQSWAQDFWFVH